MPAAMGPCSELSEFPHSNLHKNKKLRLDYRDRDFINSLGGVYFIKSGDYVKIGKSQNPSARIAQLQTAHFNLLKLIHKIPTYYDEKALIAEKALHKYFRNYLTESKNEWFRFEGELKVFIESKPNLHDLIDLFSKCLSSPQSDSDAPCHRSEINSLKKYPNEKNSFDDDSGYIRRSAAESAQTMEDLQLMLLNYKISRPKKFNRGRPCKDWLEFTKCFVCDSDACPSFSDFKYENSRLSRLRLHINRFQKFEANEILL